MVVGAGARCGRRWARPPARSAAARARALPRGARARWRAGPHDASRHPRPGAAPCRGQGWGVGWTGPRPLTRYRAGGVLEEGERPLAHDAASDTDIVGERPKCTQTSVRAQPRAGRRAKPILVTGAIRSGTGWVGQILAASPTPIGYIWEPLSVLHRPGTLAIRWPHWFPYVCAENCEPYVPAIERSLAFQYRTGAELRSVRKPKDAGRMAPRLVPVAGLPPPRRRSPVQGSHRRVLGRVAGRPVRHGRRGDHAPPVRLRREHQAAALAAHGALRRSARPAAADARLPGRLRGAAAGVLRPRARHRRSGHPALERPDRGHRPPPEAARIRLGLHAPRGLLPRSLSSGSGSSSPT